MSTGYLRLMAANGKPVNPCGCQTWGLLNGLKRDLTLYDLMRWASVFHQVEVKLLARGEHVAVCELLSHDPGQGEARRVMTELCTWADCARVTLELTPSHHWGADVDRLTRFYESLGFEDNKEPVDPWRVRETMIRYPVRGRGHGTT